MKRGSVLKLEKRGSLIVIEEEDMEADAPLGVFCLGFVGGISQVVGKELNEEGGKMRRAPFFFFWSCKFSAVWSAHRQASGIREISRENERRVFKRDLFWEKCGSFAVECHHCSYFWWYGVAV